MELKIDGLKSAIRKLNYKWFNTGPNIIGLRTTLQVPDVFNDILCLVFTQPSMPAGLPVIKQQQWLNTWAYKGKDGKLLAEDGDAGSNTKFALDEYSRTVGTERLKAYVITTEPGLYYQTTKLLSEKGCAVLKPGQYENCYQIGIHKDADHKALIQTGGKIAVYRDNDKDGLAENLGVEETGFFGCNIHGAKRMTKTDKIGAFSAGCQVFQDWHQKEEFIGICEQFKNVTGNKFTYTLIGEKDLI
jgi:hypothetical protein